MGLTSFTFETEPTERFVEFPYALHRHDRAWVPPLRGEVHALLAPGFAFHGRPGNDHRRFLAVAGGRVRARVVASVDASAPLEEGAPVGAVGLFEAENDYAAAAEVLGAAVSWLRDAHRVRRVRGPLNFDIWHGYRLLTRGFERERFYGEPGNPPYYPELFARFGFAECRRWNSFELPGALPASELGSLSGPPWRDFETRGYRIETFGLRPFRERLPLLHRLLTESFAGFPGYTPIALAEFRALMSLGRHVLHPRCSTFLFDERGTPAGFVAVLVDVADAVRAMRGRGSWVSRLRFLWRRRTARRLLLHLGGITPSEAARHSGVARAVFHHTLGLVRAERCDSVVASLVARGNPVRRLYGRHAADRRREYALFELAS
jgi:hypothetical protein